MNFLQLETNINVDSLLDLQEYLNALVPIEYLTLDSILTICYSGSNQDVLITLLIQNYTNLKVSPIKTRNIKQKTITTIGTDSQIASDIQGSKLVSFISARRDGIAQMGLLTKYSPFVNSSKTVINSIGTSSCLLNWDSLQSIELAVDGIYNTSASVNEHCEFLDSFGTMIFDVSYINGSAIFIAQKNDINSIGILNKWTDSHAMGSTISISWPVNGSITGNYISISEIEAQASEYIGISGTDYYHFDQVCKYINLIIVECLQTGGPLAVFSVLRTNSNKSASIQKLCGINGFSTHEKIDIVLDSNDTIVKIGKTGINYDGIYRVRTI